MVELFEQDVREEARQSSKGNQLKWKKDDYWYKADYTGYEGLAEYMVSSLLEYSSLDQSEYVLYKPEEIHYGVQSYTGCRSRDFLTDPSKGLKGKWQMITLERLFYHNYGESLYRSIFRIRDCENRLRFLVEQMEKLTGLRGCGVYMCKLLTIDALFLNYPLGQDVIMQMTKAEAKTFCRSFDEQLDAAQDLYGDQMWFHFGERQIRGLLEADSVYSKEVKQRVYTILLQQRRKYQYMFR